MMPEPFLSLKRPHSLLSRIPLTFVLLGLVVATFVFYVVSERRIDTANRHRQASFLLADELRQSSDDLTRMVRTYVVTGNPIYKRHFQEILDIRDGKKPRPVVYQAVYWDLVGPDDARPRPADKAVPLLALMQQAGFSAQEFAKLADAKVNSDDLTTIEFAAMALVEMTHPPVPADRERAIEMLHDARYYAAKAGIMRPMAEAIALSDQRTLAAVNIARHKAAGLRIAFVVFASLLAWQLVTLRRREVVILGGSVEKVHAEIADLRRVGGAPSDAALPDGKGSILAEVSRTKALLAALDAERKTTEGSLRQSDDILRNMQMGLYVYELENLEDDHSLRMVAANPASGKLSGAPPEGLVGKTIDEIFPALRDTGVPERFANIVRTGKSGEFENIYYGDDRLPSAAYIFKAFPLPLHRVGITFENVTEMKQTQHRLAQSEARFRSIIAASNTGAWEYDRDKGYLWCSPEYFAMLGLDLDDYPMDGSANLLESWIDLLHPDDREQASAHFSAYLEGGSVGMYENHFRMKHRNGSLVWIWSRGQTLRDSDGNLTNLTVGTHIDITERKKVEAERQEFGTRLHQTQRLESLGVLAGGIAHDFNNILMAIMGHADLALDELSPLSPGKASIAEIVAASKRAAELCGQMLAYAGKGKIEQRNMSLGGLVEETLHMLKTSISKKAILNLNLEKSLPSMYGDPAQIRQILMNLVINASDAIGERSGVITISTGAIDCSEQYLAGSYFVPPGKPATYVYIEVSDTGCGMDKTTLSHIFEPFFTTKFTGRGLGMSAVMGIVKAHEGALRVYSEPGKGTTFKVMFPANEIIEDREPEAGRIDAWQGTGTVLLVDDEESIRAISSKQLQRLGLEVLTAADGRKAVELFRERRSQIDLVLLDLTMPHMNGEEAYRELRQIDPDVRVILASGYSEHDIAAQFAGKGLAGCLQKPYTLMNLRSLLSKLLPTGAKITCEG